MKTTITIHEETRKALNFAKYDLDQKTLDATILKLIKIKEGLE